MSNTAPSTKTLQTRTARVVIGACALLVVAPFATGSAATAAPPQQAVASPVDLGTAAGYSVLAGAGVSNTGSATVLALDLGLSPTGVIAGFPPGTVTGVIHDKDAAAETAQGDRQAAYDAVVAQTGGTPFAGDLAGAIFKPGLHTSAAAITNTGTIVLDADGDPGAIFVFQIGAALSSAAASKVLLADGALAHNVYWQVTGAVSLGAGVKWVGTILGAGAVAFGEAASIKGRVMTPTTVALANSPVTKPIDDLTAPIVGIDGGPTRSTNDTTPMITGTTDEPAGRPVTVTVGGQTLRSTVLPGGAWALSATTLTPGPHTLVASVTDPSANTGTASQVLTVDTTAPLVTIAGGASAATKDVTPTISGTTNEPGNPTVTVTVGGQTLTASAAGGAWTVDAAVLSEAAHLVVASVDDAADNMGTTSQVLVVDVTVPVVTINGGAQASTGDTSPWTYGTTAEQAGTTVHLAIGGQALVATVLTGGTWGVSATTLAPGTYLVVASVTDAAQNTGTASQVLTIGGTGTTGDPGDPGGTGGTGGSGGSTGAASDYRPDAEIRAAKGTFVGKNSYQVSDQRVTSNLAGRQKSVAFEVRVTNRGDSTDRMTVVGTRRSPQFKVAYLDGGKVVTAAVLAGTYQTGVLKPGESVTLTVKVTRLKGAKPGSKRTFEIRVVSTHAKSKDDTVAAVVKALRR
jgi:hypothetical protein